MMGALGVSFEISLPIFDFNYSLLLECLTMFAARMFVRER